ncbi:MAG: hypothetical protein RLZZ458_1195 [Planctomycetota bacterium]|jgi:ABC-2 type transport system permease protein
MFHLRLLCLLARNSLIREMMFPANFLIQVVTRLFWFAARIVLFQLIYLETDSIREWSRDEYFAFMATGMLINSLVEAFFMPNCAAFCESIRTGRLDLVLTRPVDAQFLVSLQRINPAMATQTLLAVALLLLSLNRLNWPITAVTAGLFVFYVAVATAFFYSLMITTACTSIWFGRNQGLYDFWFYITIFAQYPRSIYDGADPSRFEAGEALQFAFSWIIPILLVVTIPAQTITGTATDPRFATAMLLLTLTCLLLSRRVFLWSLNAYRGASS